MDKGTGPKPRINLFGYLDETGLLHSPATDKVFGLGLTICHNPKKLHRDIINFRNRRKYYKEFKSTDIRTQNLPIYKELLDIFFDSHSVSFSGLLFDKKQLDLNKYFKGDYERAYGVYVAKLISDALEAESSKGSNYIVVLADDVSTSKDDHFEKVVKEKVKMRLRRNAVFGVARLESHAITEIQMTDVLLGIVAYSFKVKFGMVKGKGAKLEMVKYMQKKLGVSKLSQTQKIKKRGGLRFFIEEFHAK
ncbi:DUF3800 domain-containing protein [Candidatus Saccharibacteria bacterium]|nr:DUF3800 domain-containing protein [Candidatus Saccharibacteria bacterium]MBI3337834.1 DUF3800 domain-containing protein [Candidatus Saccharibacteria bacterium]